MSFTVLVVDDNKDDALLLKRELKGFNVYPAPSIESTRTLLAGGFRPDVVIADYELGDGNGLDLLVEVKSRFPKALCYLVSGHVDGSGRRAPALGPGQYALSTPRVAARV